MDTQETKIRKGQAFNLAVNDAISSESQNDVKYIYKRFLYYYNLAEIVQGSDIDLIQTAINNKEFDSMTQQIKALFTKD